MLSLHYLPGNEKPSIALAGLLDIPIYPVEIHTFPDGESRVQIKPITGTALLFCTLDNPDGKLVSLTFAAHALRQNGAKRIVLIVPYLCYMRQDIAFQEGEAISQRIFGEFLSPFFERVVTVDPHLHRIDDLQEVFGEACKAQSYSATGIIADALASEVYTERTVFVGPDSESAQWVGKIADQLMLPYIVGEKIRLGDRQVSITLPNAGIVKDARAIIVDDMISSGITICRCAEALIRAGATDVQVVTVHALCGDEDVATMMRAGVSRLCSTDSIHHPTNTISLAPLLAAALEEEK